MDGHLENRLSWHLSPIHVRTVLILALGLRIIILVMVFYLRCMSNPLQQLVIYILLYTSVKASAHFIMLVQCHHRALLFVFYYSASVSLSGLFICVYLINSRLWYQDALKYLGQSVTGSKFRLWKNNRVLA